MYKDKNDPRYLKHKAERNLKVQRWRKNTKRKIIACMGECCQSCGYFKCDQALELHHLNPEEKEISFSEIMAKPKALETIISELRKCILLCANCHREYHAGLLEIPSEFSKLDEELMREMSKRENYPKDIE